MTEVITPPASLHIKEEHSCYAPLIDAIQSRASINTIGGEIIRKVKLSVDNENEAKEYKGIVVKECSTQKDDRSSVNSVTGSTLSENILFIKVESCEPDNGSIVLLNKSEIECKKISSASTKLSDKGSHGNDTFSCPYCKKTFDSIVNLNNHKELHLGVWPYVCGICHKGFLLGHLLESHETIHKNDKTYQCLSCNKLYTSRYKLKVHMKIHANQFFCKICKEMFATQDCLKSHRGIHKQKKVNPKRNRSYSCKICTATFAVFMNYKVHMKKHSNHFVPFSCDICKRPFMRKGCLMNHVSKCLGVNPYMCDICNKSFDLQCHFVEHVQQVHNGLRPFPCNICKKRFKTKYNLEIHSQVHEPRLHAVYKCNICQLTFHSWRKLKGHKIREHSLYRPYKCNRCKKFFLFKSQLTNHSKEHKVKEL